MKRKYLGVTFLTLCLAGFCGTKAAQAASLSVVADGLNNPRGSAFDSQGNLYVAESGSGGSGADGRCIPSPSSQYIPLCAAENGSVIKIAPNGQQTTVLSNLGSIALAPTGEQAAGPADFKFDAQGNAYLLTGLAGNPAQRDSVLKEPDLGQLYKVNLQTGALTSLADIGAYELKNNPDGTDIISNPFSMAIEGNYAYVVDGGGNDIYKVALDGSGIQDVKAFPEQALPAGTLVYPPIPTTTASSSTGAPPSGTTGAPGNTTAPSSQSLPPGYTINPKTGIPASNQSVPTGITVAPDGSLTVSDYTYYPYPEGKAQLWSVDPNLTTTSTVSYSPGTTTQLTGTEIATGFTQLTGVTYDKQGDLFALQSINQSEWKAVEQGGKLIGDISGSLIEIAKDGTRKTIWSGDGLTAAADLTLGPDGDIYISNNARFAGGQGQIIKIDPNAIAKVPEPSPAIGLLAVSALAAGSILKRKRNEELCEKLLDEVEVL